jgi:hypothetical protein
MSAETNQASCVLRASSIGSAALLAARALGNGVVQGVYGSAINIATSGTMVCLVTQACGKGPLNVTLGIPGGRPMTSLGVEPGDAVAFAGETIVVGRALAVALDSAAHYSPRQRLPMPLVPEAVMNRNIAVARETGLAFGRLQGLGSLLATGRLVEPLGIFADAAARRIERLVETLRGERPGLTAAVRELVGLGPGLTPSSDDVLAGMVLLMLLYSRNSGATRVASEVFAGAIVAEAAGRTTMLSEAFLKQAADGRGSEALMALCEAVLAGESEDVARSTMRVLACGETSGTDAVLGVVLGGQLCLGGESRSRRDSHW